MTITASSLEAVFRCRPMASIEHAEWIDGTEGRTRGSVLHRFLADVPKLGVDAALAAVPEKYRDDARAIDLTRLPDLSHFAHEVAFALDWLAGTARELGRDIGRRYGDLKPTEIAGTCDIVGVAADRAVIFDWKTGWLDVAPPRENAQLLHYAACAMLVYERSIVDVAVCWIDGSGRPKMDVTTIEASELEDFIGRVRSMMFTLREPNQKFVLGPHCRRCPALPFCPALGHVVRDLASLKNADEMTAVDMAEQLMAQPPEVATLALERLRAARARLDVVEATLKIVASRSPVALPNGKVWGPVEGAEEQFDGIATFETLRDGFTTGVADDAVAFVTSKKKIGDALKKLERVPGDSFAALERRVLEMIRVRQGGRRMKPTITFRDHRPAALPAEATTTTTKDEESGP